MLSGQPRLLVSDVGCRYFLKRYERKKRELCSLFASATECRMTKNLAFWSTVSLSTTCYDYLLDDLLHLLLILLQSVGFVDEMIGDF